MLGVRSEVVKLLDTQNPQRFGQPQDAAVSRKGFGPPQVWHRDRQRPTVARVYCGDSVALELVSLDVSVIIDGPRARTVVDHVFRNTQDRALEGTFEYPLPTGASPAYYAMFLGGPNIASVPGLQRPLTPAASDVVSAPGRSPQQAAKELAPKSPQDVARAISTKDWGRLQEGRIVSRAKALETYEEIVRRDIDPALLEYSGGNTFSGRVYPIPARGYTRVLLAYEELLPVGSDGRTAYRLPLPQADRPVGRVSVSVRAQRAGCRDVQCTPPDADNQSGGGEVLIGKTWNGPNGPGGEFAITYRTAQPQVSATVGRHNGQGPAYVFARVRPTLPPMPAKPFADHAVFVLDTSRSESPDRLDVNMRLLANILASDRHIRHFNILCFDVAARWANPKGWIANTPDNRRQLFADLNGLLFEGATDFSAALDQLAGPLWGLPAGTPVDAFVLSDGQITWGAKDASSLVAGFEQRCGAGRPVRFHCYRIGLGAENAELFETLTRRGGGVFQCHGDSELVEAALAHRRHPLLIESVTIDTKDTTVSDLLVAGRRTAIYPGGELVVAACLGKHAPPDATAPVSAGRLRVRGTIAGEPWSGEFDLLPDGYGDLAARGWGELAVSALLSLNNPALEDLAVAYSQEFGIASRAASFLILENDADYKRLDLQEQRGKTLNTNDLATTLDRLWNQLSLVVPPRQALEQMLARLNPSQNLMAGATGIRIKELMAAMDDADFDWPTTPAEPDEPLPKFQDAPPSYLKALADWDTPVPVIIEEALRRRSANNTRGAVRALSGIVEAHPTRSDALRLVAYRLMDMGLHPPAVGLLSRAQAERPFEPHSYRDLAQALTACGKSAYAALLYEVVLAGSWHTRFRDTMATVAREEYLQLLQASLADKSLKPAIRNFMGRRVEELAGQFNATQDDLRVTVSWNTDNNDIDLWVFEPDGTKCYYSHNRTRNGGELSADMTQGYGPERYRISSAKPGEYVIKLHYFRANPTLLASETHAKVTITRYAGSSRETTERHNVILNSADQVVEVARMRF